MDNAGGADARARLRERAGVHAERRVVMIRVAGVHRADERDVIHALRDVWKERADFRAAGPVFGKFPLRPFQKDLLITRAAFDLGSVCFPPLR